MFATQYTICKKVKINQVHSAILFKAFNLGKPVFSNIDEFPENFRNGGGGHFRSKKFRCNFFLLQKRQFWSLISGKSFEKGGGDFRSEKFCCKFSASATGLRKKSQHFFPKRGEHINSSRSSAIFFCFRKGIFGHEFPEKASKRGGVISDLKNFIANLVLVQPVCGKNRNIFFTGFGVYRLP